MSEGGKIKLRTAGDCISRLRWSEEEDCGRVLIGYDDRIKGPMEKSVADFKSMDEGGDIPQHRIQYFRRAAEEGARIRPSEMNMMILWEKEGRIDRIFGSGMGRDAPASEKTIQQAFDAIINMQRIAEEQEIRRQEKAKQRARRQRRARMPLQQQPGGVAQSPIHTTETTGDRHVWSNESWFTFSGDESSWTAGGFEKSKVAPNSGPERNLTCVTWNVLFDEFKETRLFDGDNANERWALAIVVLGAAKADLVALQEVTPEFVELLCGASWVREEYAVSVAPGATSCVEPFGNLLLWRRDSLKAFSPALGVSVLSDGPRKRAVVSCLQSVQDPTAVFVCACVHLPCDATGADEVRLSRATARRRELNAIAAKLQSVEQRLASSPARAVVPIVLGDFNSDAAVQELEEGGFIWKNRRGFLVDSWPLVSNGRDGFTYDPDENERARHSVRGKRRIDRVLVGCRGNAPMLNPSDGKLLGAESGIEGVPPPSDHYGLSVSFGWQTKALARRDRRCLAGHNGWAGTVLPSTDTLLAVTLSQPDMPLFDTESSLPVPHITLLNGFAELLSMESRELATKAVTDAVERFLEATQQCEIPFDKDSLTVFEHRSSASLVAKAGCKWLESLYQSLRAVFPLCDEQESRFVDGWTPHVTLGKYGTEAEARNQANGWVSEGLWFQGTRSVPAEAVVIYQRDPRDRKFYAVATVPLERKPRNLQACPPREFMNDAGASLSSYYLKSSTPFFSTIERVCRDCIHEMSGRQLEASLLKYGSCNFHASLPTISDIDAVVDVAPRAGVASGLPNLSGSAFWQLVAARLQSIHKNAKIRLRIAGANGTAIQFLTVKVCPQAPSVDLVLNLRDANGEPLMGSAASDSIEDSRQILNELRAQERGNAVVVVFEGALRLLKLWAFRRQIYGASVGFIGGGGWALLLARAMCIGLSTGGLVLAVDEGGSIGDACQDVLSYFFAEMLRSWEHAIFNLREEATTASDAAKDTVISRGTIAVLAPCSGENFARNATRSTTATMLKELQRANALIKTGSFEDSFYPLSQTEVLQEQTSVFFLEVSIGRLVAQGACLPEVKAWAACQMLQAMVALERELGDASALRPFSRPVRIKGKLLYIATVASVGVDLEPVLRKRRTCLEPSVAGLCRRQNQTTEGNPFVQMNFLAADAFQNQFGA